MTEYFYSGGQGRSQGRGEVAEMVEKHNPPGADREEEAFQVVQIARAKVPGQEGTEYLICLQS